MASTLISIFVASKYKGYPIKFKDYQVYNSAWFCTLSTENYLQWSSFRGKSTIATIWATFDYDDTYSGQLRGLICRLVHCGPVVDWGIVHTARLPFGGSPFVHGCGSPVLITGVIIISEEALLFSVLPVFYLIILTGLLLPLHLPIIIQSIYCYKSSVKFQNLSDDIFNATDYNFTSWKRSVFVCSHLNTTKPH